MKAHWPDLRRRRVHVARQKPTPLPPRAVAPPRVLCPPGPLDRWVDGGLVAMVVAACLAMPVALIFAACHPRSAPVTPEAATDSGCVVDERISEGRIIRTADGAALVVRCEAGSP